MAYDDMTYDDFMRGLGPVRRFETAHGPVSFIDAGEGPVVLALHGAMGGYDQGALLARTVLGSGGYRLIAPSRPGFPGTPSGGQTGPKLQADLIAALLAALGVETALVLAISGGGPCALHLSLRHPGLCAGLILCSTVSRPNPIIIPGRFAVLKLMARLPGVAGLLRRRALKNFAATLARSFPDPAQREALMSDPEACGLFRVLSESTFVRMAARLPGSEADFRITALHDYALEDIRSPTLIVHGTNDPYVDFETHALSAVARISGSELLALDNGGHAAIFSHRAQLRSGVADWVKRQFAHTLPSSVITPES